MANDKLQNLSYTNLDFQDIYTEVVSLIKELTYDYDPTISDESDPGVIYTKLGALLADKINYNVDKSVLEAFPASVTQMSSARQLYDSLGYYMHYIQGATCWVSLSYTADSDTVSESLSYTIPKFTTVTDSDNTVNYTLLGTEGDDGIVISDGTLYRNENKILKMIAMEGVSAQFTFNNETTIIPTMVDDDNRLYFESAMVPENGVFINNVGQANWASWKRVDNLYEQSYNGLRYKFGYDSVSNLNYIELPDNYAELMGSGIEINYLITSENSGDITVNTLSRFLSAVTPVEDTGITLNSNNTTITNFSKSTGHADEETLEEAYRGYQRTVGTYKTLITLRDYLNYILNMDDSLYTNGFVCDRTDDLQTVYRVIGKKNGIDTYTTKIEQIGSSDVGYVLYQKTTDTYIIPGKIYYTYNKVNKSFDVVGFPLVTDLESYYEFKEVSEKEDFEDAMEPFSLKFYLLKKAVSLKSIDAFNETFDMSWDASEDLETTLEETSHLEHSYEHLLPISDLQLELNRDEVDTTTIYYDKKGKVVNPNQSATSNIYIATKAEVNTALGAGGQLYMGHIDLSTGECTEPTLETVLDEHNTLLKTDGTTYTTSVVSNPYQVSQGASPVLEYASLPIKSELHDNTTNVDLWTGQVRTYIIEGTASVVDYKYFFVEKDMDDINPSSIGYDTSTSSYNGYEWYVYDTATSSYVRTTDTEYDATTIYYVRDYSKTGTVYKEIIPLQSLADDLKAKIGATLLIPVLEGWVDGETIQPIESSDSYPVWYTHYGKSLTELYVKTGEDILSHVCFFKNVFPINANIITYDTLDKDTKSDVKANIINALYTALDSSKLDFGERVTIDYLTETIIDSDARIKSAYLDGVTYTTHAVFYDSVDEEFKDVVLHSQLTTEQQSDQESVWAHRIEKEIIARSVVGGVTQLLVEDDDFAIHLNQQYIDDRDGVEEVSTETIIDMGAQTTVYAGTGGIKKKYKLRENEILSFLRPSLTESVSFSYGCRIEYIMEEEIEAGTSHLLNSGEYLVAYARIEVEDSSSEDEVSSYTAYVLGPGSIITPTFTMAKRPLLETTLSSVGKFLVDNYEPDEDSTMMTRSDLSDVDINVITTDSTLVANTLSSTSTIATQKLNRATFEESDKYGCIWFLNNATYSNNGTLKTYTLFDAFTDEDAKENKTSNSYTLKAGEYFIYTNESHTSLSILGSGNTIQRNCGVDTDGNIIPLDPFGTIDITTTPITISYDGYVAYVPLTLSADGLPSFSTDVLDLFGNTLANYVVLDKNPHKTGLYEESAGVFSRTADITIDTTKTYYALLERGHSGLTEVTTETIDDSNTSSFAPYVPATVGDFNPVALGLYEEIRYDVVSTDDTEGKNVQDEYKLKNAESTTTLNRYALSEDTSRITKVVFGTTSDGTIVIAEGDESNFSPVNNSWYELTTSTTPSTYLSSTAITPFTTYDHTYGDISGLYHHIEVPSADTNYFAVSSTQSSFLYDADKKRYFYPMANLGNMNAYLDTLVSVAQSGLQLSSDVESSFNVWNYDYINPIYWFKKVFTANATGTYTRLIHGTKNTSGTYDREYYTISEVEDIRTALESVDEYYIGDNLYVNGSGYSMEIFVPNTKMVSALTDSTNLVVDDTTYYEPLTTPIAGSTNVTYTFKNVTLADMSTLLPYGKLYFVPSMYKLNDYYTTNGKTYYYLKDYGYRSFGTIDPWTCYALDITTVSQDPFGEVGDYWEPVQTHCSITVIENDIYTLTENDVVTLVSDKTDANNVNWPTFTNDEVTLDYSQYSVSYQRDGGELTELPSVSIGYDWRAYSGLLLNVSSTSPQALRVNQYLTVYSTEDDSYKKYVGENNVYFELKYEVENETGTHIKVTAEDDFGNELTNSIYVFRELSSVDGWYTYGSDYRTTLVTKGESASNPLPVQVKIGDYILPINGLDEDTINYVTFNYCTTDGSTYVEHADVLELYSTGKTTVSPSDWVYYFKLSIPDDILLVADSATQTTTSGNPTFDPNITVALNTLASENVVIEDIYRYTESNESYLNGMFDEVKEKVVQLDTDDEYNYTWKCDESDEIENPLLPSDMWRVSNVFKKYIIPKWDPENSIFNFTSGRE